MSKYNIDKSFGVYRFLKPPFSKPIFPIAKGILSVFTNNISSNDEVEIEKVQISSAEETIKGIYFKPKASNTDKILLYIHGGGFCFQGSKHHLDCCFKYALDGDVKVLYVDYRLAPKYQYPIANDDCYNAYMWIYQNAAKLSIDKNKIIIGGDSAGGFLSIDLTFRLLSENIHPLSLMAVYPVVDKDLITPSKVEYTKTPLWNSRLNEKMWEYYLGNNIVESFFKRDVTLFPKTYIETAQYDCLRDEGISFANYLKEHAVITVLNETMATMHGFDISNNSITKNALLQRIDFIKHS